MQMRRVELFGEASRRRTIPSLLEAGAPRYVRRAIRLENHSLDVLSLSEGCAA